jgi:hypothetical protein
MKIKEFFEKRKEQIIRDARTIAIISIFPLMLTFAIYLVAEKPEQYIHRKNEFMIQCKIDGHKQSTCEYMFKTMNKSDDFQIMFMR